MLKNNLCSRLTRFISKSQILAKLETLADDEMLN